MPADAAEIVRLAERVEQATGPDRGLDADIAHVVGHAQRRGGYLYAWCEAGSTKEIVRPPAYTASLDAAMTLVPEGAGFNLDRYWIREGVRWKVEIATGGIPEQPRQVFDCWDAYTAPLATVAAALRARAAQHDHEVG